MGTKNLLIPTTEDGFTPEWLSALLGISISSSDFKLSGNVQAGTGFLSSIFRVSCHTTPSDKEPSQQLNLIMKVLPMGQSDFEQISKQLAIDQKFDITEINFYEKLLPDILAELPSLEPYFCKFYSSLITESPRNSILVMEDLKPLGYYSRTFAEEPTTTQTEDTVKFIAKFHYAVNAVVHKKGKPMKELYPFLPSANDKEALKSYVLEGFKTLDEFFEIQNCSEEFRAYWLQLHKVKNYEIVFDKMYEALFTPMTVNHGDLWTNNAMFTDDATSSSVKVIDWQLLSPGDPIFDLSVIIVAFLPVSKLNVKNVTLLVDLYWETYEKCCKENGMDVLVTRSYEEFSRKLFKDGMAYVYIWFTYARDPFVNNFPRLLKIYEFLYKDIDIMPFFLSLAES